MDDLRVPLFDSILGNPEIIQLTRPWMTFVVLKPYGDLRPIPIDSDHGPWKTWKGFRRFFLPFITIGLHGETIYCVRGLMILCSACALTTTVV